MHHEADRAIIIAALLRGTERKALAKCIRGKIRCIGFAAECKMKINPSLSAYIAERTDIEKYLLVIKPLQLLCGRQKVFIKLIAVGHCR